MTTQSAGDGVAEKGQRPVLLIDALSLYLRAYWSFPQMSPRTGQPIGGCVGFLKMLGRIASETAPSQVVVCWEGGGSTKRRALHGDYKKGRRPDRPNRFYEDDIPDTDDNKVWQVSILTKMLRCLPVCQVYVPDCEGDDVVAYLATGRFVEKPKVLVTSDKDLYQLIDETTTVYDLHSKVYVTHGSLFERFRVSAMNFGLAKALCGDRGDNIEGVPGLGFKTLVKRFPFLGSDQHQILLSDVLNYSEAHADEAKTYRDVLAHRELLERNWKLVHLSTAALSGDQAARVDHALDTSSPVSDKLGLIRRLVAEGIGDLDVDGLLYAFVGIETAPHAVETTT